MYFYSDINECNDSPCTENQVCFNNAGSYLCECNLGYERDPNSGTTSPGVYLGCKGVLCIRIVCVYTYNLKCIITAAGNFSMEY